MKYMIYAPSSAPQELINLLVKNKCQYDGLWICDNPTHEFLEELRRRHVVAINELQYNARIRENNENSELRRSLRLTTSFSRRRR